MTNATKASTPPNANPRSLHDQAPPQRASDTSNGSVWQQELRDRVGIDKTTTWSWADEAGDAPPPREHKKVMALPENRVIAISLVGTHGTAPAQKRRRKVRFSGARASESESDSERVVDITTAPLPRGHAAALSEAAATNAWLRGIHMHADTVAEAAAEPFLTTSPGPRDSPETSNGFGARISSNVAQRISEATLHNSPDTSKSARPPPQLNGKNIAAAVRLGVQSAGLAWIQQAGSAEAALPTATTEARAQTEASRKAGCEESAQSSNQIHVSKQKQDTSTGNELRPARNCCRGGPCCHFCCHFFCVRSRVCCPSGRGGLLGFQGWQVQPQSMQVQALTLPCVSGRLRVRK